MKYEVERNDLKTRSDLMIHINSRLIGLEGDIAGKLGITPERLDDLRIGKIDRFKLLELQSLARRAGLSRLPRG
jgi:predicted XRE-type DNA-binding protein